MTKKCGEKEHSEYEEVDRSAKQESRDEVACQSCVLGIRVADLKLGDDNRKFVTKLPRNSKAQMHISRAKGMPQRRHCDSPDEGASDRETGAIVYEANKVGLRQPKRVGLRQPQAIVPCTKIIEVRRSLGTWQSDARQRQSAGIDASGPGCNRLPHRLACPP